MKKYLFIIICLLTITGCQIKKDTSVIDTFINTINKSKSYRILGTMEIQNDEVIYEYDLNIAYLKDNNYKIEMTNKSNNQMQVILRNDDGVYV